MEKKTNMFKPKNEPYPPLPESSEEKIDGKTYLLTTFTIQNEKADDVKVAFMEPIE